MRIDINQHKIALGDKYKIFLDGQQVYSASSELFRFLAVINLYAEGSTNARLTIRKKWAWLQAKYAIQTRDYDNLEFRGFSFWKMLYQCQVGADMYHIYGHRGRKYSVYRNNTQAGWWEKQKVTWFAGDNYTIVADDDMNPDLIIAFCLIIDNYSYNSRDSHTVSVDFGHIFGQVRKFNPEWQPKS